MKVLLVCATKEELAPFFAKLGWENSADLFNYRGIELHALITGVGMVATAFSLGQKLAKFSYSLAINIGIAGAFDRQLNLGEVVEVISDQFSEMGAEDQQSFISLAEMGLTAENEFPFKNGLIKAISPTENFGLQKVNGITVNTVHGNEESIQQVTRRLNPQIESMEGAAFLYSCRMARTQCIQLRAVSNYVEKRNKSNWEIALALDNLAKQLEILLNKL